MRPLNTMLAFQLHDRGETEKAIQHYKELLELNPGDNQGVRYDLFIAYIDKNRLEDAEALLKKQNVRPYMCWK